MKTCIRSLALFGILALASTASAQESLERATVSLSDPSRPAEIRVRLVNGSISVETGATNQVVVETLQRVPRDEESSDGLRRLPQAPSLQVEERNNRVEVGTRQPNVSVHLRVQVPARADLILSTVNEGNIEVEGVEGELEIGNVNGSIALKDVAGSVLANTVNGSVTATLTRVTDRKPMAFTSLNGRVDVTLPGPTRANLRLRTDNGRILTDFDLTVIPQAPAPVEDTQSTEGRYRIGRNKVVYGSINGGGADIELRTFNGEIVVRKGN
jgi:DUF4097 and DUF4098 domain-containing protein YvlB